MNTVLVGMFDSQSEAQQARQQLIAAGFAASAVSLTGDQSTSSTGAPTTTRAQPSSENESGPIARFFENLFGDEDADTRDRYGATYSEALRRGAHGLTVQAANDSECDKAEAILNKAGAIDIDTRSETWRQEGWSGGVMPATSSTAAGSTTTLQDGATRTLQEVEEELKVGKRSFARGGVRIFSRTLEVPVEESVTLREEHANVQRRTVDRPATEADFASFKEGSIEVREMAEEAVVSKTARVVGEVEISKSATEREETVRDTVRRTQVDVEPIDDLATANPSSRTTAYAGSTGSVMGTTDGSANRDPITGEPGAHPIGTGVGALAGGVAAGAAAGSVVGPIGTAVGAAAGAVVGGLAGKGVAEKVDPTNPAAVTRNDTPRS